MHAVRPERSPAYKGATLPHEWLPAGLLNRAGIKPQTAVQAPNCARDIGSPCNPARKSRLKQRIQGSPENRVSKAANQSTPAINCTRALTSPPIDQPTYTSHHRNQKQRNTQTKQPRASTTLTSTHPSIVELKAWGAQPKWLKNMALSYSKPTGTGSNQHCYQPSIPSHIQRPEERR